MPTPPLASYAVTELTSRGRQFPTDSSHDRTPFQRDYTRILHSRAFRRLQGKTQVFSAASGDMFRTRMSHSMEVEQISRSIAHQLNINEDLCATLAIGHDIGHPPFGHLGQDVLNELMKGRGGFEHNHQALRLVDEIECCYIEHRGLNLLFETREGLLKHCSKERAEKLGDVGLRHVNNTSPTLEAQVVDWADSIAYLHADLEDAFVKNLLTMADLKAAPGFMKSWDKIKENKKYAHLDLPDAKDFLSSSSAENQRQSRAIILTVLRQMMSTAVNNLIQTTRANLVEAKVQTVHDVRNSPPLVGFSPDHQMEHRALKRFSLERIYNHPDVIKERAGYAQNLRELFVAYVNNPKQMSGRGPEWSEMADATNAPSPDIYRVVTDHLAGMTDAFALSEHLRLKMSHPEWLMAKDLPAVQELPTAQASAVARRRIRAR
jgi:dGTPase